MKILNSEMAEKLKSNASKVAFDLTQSNLRVFYRQIKEEILKTDSEDVNVISGHYYSKEGKLMRPTLNFLLS